MYHLVTHPSMVMLPNQGTGYHQSQGFVYTWLCRRLHIAKWLKPKWPFTFSLAQGMNLHIWGISPQ